MLHNILNWLGYEIHCREKRVNYFLLAMLIPKKNRKAVYEHLFKEGVVVAKKDFNAPSHPHLKTVPNLQVIKAMQVCYTCLLCWIFLTVIKYIEV